MQPLPQCPLVHHLCTFGCNEADTEQAHNFPRSDPILHLKYALQDQEQGKGIQQQLEQTREHKGRTIATTLQQAWRQLLQTGTASTAVSCRIVEFRPEAWSAQCICRASPAQQAIKVKIKAWKIFMHDFLLSRSPIILSQPIFSGYLNSSLSEQGQLQHVHKLLLQISLGWLI